MIDYFSLGENDSTGSCVGYEMHSNGKDFPRTVGIARERLPSTPCRPGGNYSLYLFQCAVLGNVRGGDTTSAVKQNVGRFGNHMARRDWFHKFVIKL